MTHPDTPELDMIFDTYLESEVSKDYHDWPEEVVQVQNEYVRNLRTNLKAALTHLLAKRELEGRIAALVAMRENMYNYYHIVTATMNDKEAISTFDYEFEEQTDRLREELAKYDNPKEKT